MIHIPGLEQHFEVQEKLLKIFSETLVILVTPNCELFQEKIEKLGCSIAQNGILARTKTDRGPHFLNCLKAFWASLDTIVH